MSTSYNQFDRHAKHAHQYRRADTHDGPTPALQNTNPLLMRYQAGIFIANLRADSIKPRNHCIQLDLYSRKPTGIIFRF